MHAVCVYENDNCAKIIFVIIIPYMFTENYTIFINNFS